MYVKTVKIVNFAVKFSFKIFVSREWRSSDVKLQSLEKQDAIATILNYRKNQNTFLSSSFEGPKKKKNLKLLRDSNY